MGALGLGMEFEENISTSSESMMLESRHTGLRWSLRRQAYGDSFFCGSPGVSRVLRVEHASGSWKAPNIIRFGFPVGGTRKEV